MKHGPEIELCGVGLRYGQQPVLSEMNHRFRAGQCHLIMGPNGGGKTSLLRSIMGLTPFDGKITLHWPSEAKQRIGYVPQKALFESSLPISVLDFMLLNISRAPLFLQKWLPSYASHQALAYRALARVGMEQRAHLRLGQLSGGELQRVMFAQALWHEPELLILDEPATGMDEQGVQYLEQLMAQLVEQGVTLLAVHHDISAVKRILQCTPGQVHVVNRAMVDSGNVQQVLSVDKLERLFQHHSQQRLLERGKAA
ncbi:metal ABC transporter ATP-binding protein [Vibrio navarrensis]|uniref:metal ABC transporter ATP-binding protein n=1 Tax=Vibrio navarrensis TaxID=29495 RepID=UPI00186A11C3|nr:metal ABC transporter ATP-binding protein [Vibrio navarrensis]MBE4580823.1 ABC transporter ATP-binding protein [Vibrio navarrensis]